MNRIESLLDLELCRCMWKAADNVIRALSMLREQNIALGEHARYAHDAYHNSSNFLIHMTGFGFARVVLLDFELSLETLEAWKSGAMESRILDRIETQRLIEAGEVF